MGTAAFLGQPPKMANRFEDGQVGESWPSSKSSKMSLILRRFFKPTFEDSPKMANFPPLAIFGGQLAIFGTARSPDRLSEGRRLCGVTQ
jgi:hypothetical protein